jgi:hypothetical protein
MQWRAVLYLWSHGVDKVRAGQLVRDAVRGCDVHARHPLPGSIGLQLGSDHLREPTNMTESWCSLAAWSAGGANRTSPWTKLTPRAAALRLNPWSSVAGSNQPSPLAPKQPADRS